MEKNALEELMEAKAKPRKKKAKTAQERLQQAIAEGLKDYHSFDLDGKQIYYRNIEDLELMYHANNYTMAIAQVHLRDDADKPHFVKAYSLAYTAAKRANEVIMAQLQKEIETVEAILAEDKKEA